MQIIREARVARKCNTSSKKGVGVQEALSLGRQKGVGGQEAQHLTARNEVWGPGVLGGGVTWGG
eukprot:1136803-Pelagomonas_calceolata.AAC.3